MGNFVRTYTPEKTANYENLVKVEYRRQCHDYQFDSDVPLDVRIMAYYGIPKSASKKKKELMEKHSIRPLKKCDADNLAKCILDAGNGVIYPDDKQVVDLQVRRFYSNTPRVVVTIQEAWTCEKIP